MYHVNVSRLNGRIVEAGMTKESLADKIGLARSTFFRRLKSNSLRICDVHGICEALNLSAAEACDIFLSQ
ncbi:MAG: helix-turn-helix domain-containing protein [Oscillospiraceae bacterium]|nr:helix-turn-helix domain-containing protein [Oscillospiraceae bacterium]